jgi:branched-chain amino acid transport system ATP-binding protein
VRSFQITNLFASFTVMENIALAVAQREGVGATVSTTRGFPSHIADEAQEIASRMRLYNVGLQKVTELAYGQQRLVELAIAFGLRPTVLLLDEPAAGLPAADHAVILEVIHNLPSNVAVLLIEHDMALVFGFAQVITVLAGGAILATGSPSAIRNDQRVRKAYLGTRA